MTTLSQARPYSKSIEILRATSEERNFIEQIKALSFLEAVLKVETMYGRQSKLGDKDSPSILKHNFFSRADPSILTWIWLESNENKTGQTKQADFFPALKTTSLSLP